MYEPINESHKKVSGIYGIKNVINNKWYVGQSVDLWKRTQQSHFLELKANKHANAHLQNAWNKYYEISFEFLVLELVELNEETVELNKKLLTEREQHWIDELNSCENGYNIAPVAGSSLGLKASPETKAKMSVSRTGKSPTEETRKKLSETNSKIISPVINRKFYTYKGKTQCIRDWAKEYNINNGTLKDRLKNGMTIEQALETPLSIDRKAKIYTYKGKDYTLTELSKEFNISNSALKDRFVRGWSLEEAIETPLIQTDTYTYKNKSQTIANWAKEYNMPYNTLLDRLKKMSIEEALETELIPRIPERIFNYKCKNLTLKQISKEYNIAIHVLNNRLNACWSIEDAIETPLKKAKLYFYHDEYKSLPELSKKYNISESNLKQRLKKGMTIEQAIDAGVRKYSKQVA